jgi:hypothetical protein
MIYVHPCLMISPESPDYSCCTHLVPVTPLLAIDRDAAAAKARIVRPGPWNGTISAVHTCSTNSYAYADACAGQSILYLHSCCISSTPKRNRDQARRDPMICASCRQQFPEARVEILAVDSYMAWRLLARIDFAARLFHAIPLME